MDLIVETIKNFQTIIGFVVLIITNLSAYYFWLIKPIKRMEERMDLIEESEKAVLTSRIFSICEDALRRKFTTTEELKNVQAIYKAYREFGLNGAAKEIYERFKDLPIQGVDK